LSQTGLFANASTLTPAPGLVEYKVNSPLWSDGARKRRWIALPGTQQIGFSADGNWSFPVGTAFVKHFELPVTASTTRRVETRVLLHQNDGWVGYTYRWNAAQTDATLLTDAASETFTVNQGGGSTQQTWQYPSPGQCLGCHTSAAGFVLGVRTPQLNRNFAYAGGSDQQLHALRDCLGLFDQSLGNPASYPVWVDPSDTSHSIAERSRSYLAANCSHRHRPGAAPGSMDMRARRGRGDEPDRCHADVWRPRHRRRATSARARRRRASSGSACGRPIPPCMPQVSACPTSWLSRCSKFDRLAPEGSTRRRRRDGRQRQLSVRAERPSRGRRRRRAGRRLRR
jgi:hypothetical protein